MNCQNFPRKTGDVTRFDYQHPIKRMFITRFKNGALLQLDYSSLESRIMALDAYDEEMIEAFLTGKDVHTETASLVFRKPQEEVTGDERSDAKKVTFGFKLCRAFIQQCMSKTSLNGHSLIIQLNKLIREPKALRRVEVIPC